MIRGFDPIVGPGARVLVLGTIPSARSLELGQYYGHSRNAFWPIMQALFAGGARARLSGARGNAGQCRRGAVGRAPRGRARRQPRLRRSPPLPRSRTTSPACWPPTLASTRSSSTAPRRRRSSVATWPGSSRRTAVSLSAPPVDQPGQRRHDDGGQAGGLAGRRHRSQLVFEVALRPLLRVQRRGPLADLLRRPVGRVLDPAGLRAEVVGAGLEDRLDRQRGGVLRR